MNIIIQKFGGTSVENKEKLDLAIDKISNAKALGNKVVVIVSAQGNTTNNLVTLAKQHVSDYINYKKEMDMLLCTGELQTVALLTMMLKNKNIEAVGLSGEQAGIITDSNYSNAHIQRVVTENLLKYLQDDLVVVVAGFQGVDKYGNITTLGRGGSDLTAVAIASSLKAKRCEIYTDVDGIYTGDPKVIHKANLLKKISYNEMLEAASVGAKVLHNRCVGLAKDHKLKIQVKGTFSNVKGTSVQNITLPDTLEKYYPKIIVTKDGFSKITLVGEGLLSNSTIVPKIYEIANKMKQDIFMINLSEISVTIIVSTTGANEFANELHDNIILKSN